MPQISSESVQSQRIYRQLRQSIVQCIYQPGMRLRVVEIAGQESVSPGAVREALAALAHAHLVVPLPQRGFRVAPMKRDDMFDIYTARSDLEGVLVERSVEKGGPVWRKELSSSYDDMVAHGRKPLIGVQLAQAHEAFHRTLLAGTDSLWSLRMFDMLYAASERYRYFAYRFLSGLRDPSREHADIIEAALAGNGPLVRRLCESHILLTRDLLYKALESSTFEMAVA